MYDIKINNIAANLISKVHSSIPMSLTEKQINRLIVKLTKENQSINIALLFRFMGQEQEDYNYEIKTFTKHLLKELTYVLQESDTNVIHLLQYATITYN